MSCKCTSKLARCWSRKGFIRWKTAVHFGINDRTTGPEARCCVIDNIGVAVGYCGNC